MYPNLRFLRPAALAFACMALSAHAAVRVHASSPTLTRADLASAYLRFERAFQATPPAASQLAEVNRAFDRATMAFFSGNNSSAIKTINGLTESLLSPEGRTDEIRIAGALKVRMTPRTMVLRDDVTLKAAITSMYTVDDAPEADVTLALRLRRRSTGHTVDTPFIIRAGEQGRFEQVVSLEKSVPALAPGQYDVLIAGGGFELAASELAVVTKSLDTVRRENEERLKKIETNDPELEQALASCRARNGLLTDAPAEDNSAQFLADAAELVPRIAEEIEELIRGRNPFRRRLGDTWRVLIDGKTEIPMRVYAPAAGARESPMPLVVALHGMGGDENMFFDGYGAGRIKRLADEFGFLVVAPRTYPFGGNPRHLDRLVRVLAVEYPVDRDRVYVMGHSMGAGVAIGLARSRGRTVAAVCALAGGSIRRADASMAPTILFAGELDPLGNARNLKRAAEAAAAAGAPVEFRMLADHGHTLMVGEALPEAIRWLLTHRLDSTRRASSTTKPAKAQKSNPATIPASRPSHDKAA